MHPYATTALDNGISVVSTGLAEKLFKFALKTTQDQWRKSKIDWGSAFQAYLNKARERSEKMKKLLYRHEAKPLYDFYEFVDIKRGDEIIHTRHVRDVLKQGRNLIITGSGGVGKTVMLKHFFLDSILAHQQGDVTFVPVLVELRGLNDQKPENVDVLSFIYQIMRKFGFNMERQHYDYSMEKGC